MSKTSLDNFGDPLPPKALARIGTVRYRHPGGAAHLFFLPDGDLLSVGPGVCRWDLRSGKLKQHHKTVEASSMYAARAKDEPWLLLGGKNHLLLMNYATGETRPLATPKQDICGVGYSPDQRRIIVGYHDGWFELRDGGTGSVIKADFLSFGALSALASCPERPWAALTNAHGVVSVFDYEVFQSLWAIRGHGAEVKSLGFSPDGQLLASGSYEDKSVRLWQSVSGQSPWKWSDDENEITGVAFSSNSTEIAVGCSRSIKFLEVQSGMVGKNWIDPIYCPASFAFSPDGVLFGACNRGPRLTIFDLVNQRDLTAEFGNLEWIQNLAISNSGKLLAFTGMPWIPLWSLDNMRLESNLPGHRRGTGFQPNNLAFSHDASYLASSGLDNTTRVWRLADQSEYFYFDEFQGFHHPVAFSRVTDLFVTGDDGGRTTASRNSLGFWDVKHKKLVKIIESCLLLDDFFDIPVNERLPHQEDWGPHFVAFSPSEELLATAGIESRVSGKCVIRLWLINDDYKCLKIEANDDIISAIRFSNDGSKLASASFDSQIYIIDVPTRKAVFSFPCPANVESLAFSKDDKLLAIPAMDGTVYLYEVATGRVIHQFIGHTNRATCVAFTPDGRRLISGSWDSTALIWDVTPYL